LLDDPSAQEAKLPQHLKKIRPAKLGELKMIQGRARRAAKPRWQNRGQVISAQIKLAL
jgi:hypothetical protein